MLTDNFLSFHGACAKRSFWQSEIEELEREFGLLMGTALPESDPHLIALRRKVANAYVHDGTTVDYRAYGAFVYGPLFYGYGRWCLNKAKKLKVKKIFCFTREAHFLVPLLKTWVTDDTDIEIRPLAVSRHFTRLINIERVNATTLCKLFSPRAQYTGADFFDVLGVKYAANPYCDAGALLPAGQLKILLEWVVNQPHLLQTISTFIEQQQASFIAYLQSMEFFNEAQVAVCDLGWSGSTQRALGKFLKSKRYRVHITGLYLATTTKAVELLSSHSAVYSYLIQYGQPETLAQALFRSPETLENITMPAHGSLKCIEDTRPVFSASLLSPLQQQQAQDLQTGILDFVAQAHYSDEGLWAQVDELRTNQLMLLRSLISPALFEIEFFSHWHAEFNLGLTHINPIIPERAWLQQQFTNRPLILLCSGYEKSKIYWLGAAMMQLGGTHLRNLFSRLLVDKGQHLLNCLTINANAELVGWLAHLAPTQLQYIRPFINLWCSEPLSEREIKSVLYEPVRRKKKWKRLFKAIGNWYRQIRYGDILPL